MSGAFFGYFFATQGGATVTIKRISLTGGAATVLATLTNIDAFNNRRNLATDGVNLYWQDVSSVRKMPIGGGAITVLDPSQPKTPTAGVALQGVNLIYASVNDIRFVPTAGTTIPPASRTIVTAASRVTALHAVSNGVYWGEQSGAVKLKVGSTITTLPPLPAFRPPRYRRTVSRRAARRRGVSAARRHVCSSSSSPGGPSRTPSAPMLSGCSSTSAGNVFWGDAAGVHRQVF